MPTPREPGMTRRRWISGEARDGPLRAGGGW